MSNRKVNIQDTMAYLSFQFQDDMQLAVGIRRQMIKNNNNKERKINNAVHCIGALWLGLIHLQPLTPSVPLLANGSTLAERMAAEIKSFTQSIRMAYLDTHALSSAP